MERLEDRTPRIDLRGDDLQDIGRGFSVGQLRVTSEPPGARIRGLLVNRMSVGIESAQFEIAAEGKQAKFSAMKLPAGGSSHFAVYFPDVAPEKLSQGWIRYLSSTVTFRK
jgi:hypothetical protein